MKRFLSVAIFVLALTVTGCGDKYVTEEYNVRTKTIHYTVKSTDWHRGSDVAGPYLYYAFDEPELTANIINQGLVAAYMRLEGQFTPLPFEDFRIGENGYLYSEQVTCEFRTGEATFIFKTSDHILEPEFDYDFTLRIIW
ncbi:MAG: hypothetical protein LBF79_00525 [Dysgonamonadaceae bacterium]|jgi:hypothetical protein|nr:hypothetical protein [Dysgonamonadaceae bacterium]